MLKLLNVPEMRSPLGTAVEGLRGVMSSLMCAGPALPECLR